MNPSLVSLCERSISMRISITCTVTVHLLNFDCALEGIPIRKTRLYLQISVLKLNTKLCTNLNISTLGFVSIH